MESVTGPYLGTYYGFSTNPEIRNSSSSGGLVTEILAFALEEGMVDGALVTRMNPDDPLEPETFIARTREEVLECSGSKYCPTPVNAALRAVLDSDKGERFAIVGLPCHVEGLSKACESVSKLKGRITLKLGLFCNHTPTFWGTRSLINKLDVGRDEIAEISYRGEGYPGFSKVELKDGRTVRSSFPSSWDILGSSLFYATGCLVCDDGLCEKADISFGDAWLPMFSNDDSGTSLTISRTELGEEILDRAVDAGRIQLGNIGMEEILDSQGRMLYLKKASIEARGKLLGVRISPSRHLTNPFDYLHSVFYLCNSQIISRLARSRIIGGKVSSLSKRAENAVWQITMRMGRDFPGNPKTTIGIVNHTSCLNKGTAALVKTRVKLLNELIPNARFQVFGADPDFTPEMEYLKDVDITFSSNVLSIGRSPKVLFKSFKNLIEILLASKGWGSMGNESVRRYHACDYIVSTGGDMLTEDYGLLSLASTASNLTLGKTLGKPVIIYAESVGPFKKRLSRMLAKYTFRRVDLITLRDEISKGHLLDIGVEESRIHVTTDSAFLFEPAPEDRVNEILEQEGLSDIDGLLFGIAPSKIIASYGFDDIQDSKAKYEAYTSLMSKLVEYINSKMNASVVLVPHVMGPGRNDDRIVSRDIVQKLGARSRCISLEKEYASEEVKGIIGKCDLFIGSRMHSTIASTSQSVPTIAIAYSHKTHGIIGRILGQEDFILDVKDLNMEKLIDKIEKIWNRKDQVSEELSSIMGSVRAEAVRNGILVSDFINSNE